MNKWDKFYKEDPNAFDQVSSTIKEILKYKKQGSVLDLGCGKGKNAIFLAENGFKVEGIDISKLAIKEAKERVKEKNLKISFKALDMGRLKYNKKYDIIINNRILHYFKKEKGLEIIKNMQKNTDRGGINLISAFIAELPFFYNGNKDMCYFKKKQLKEIYKEWEILSYKEKIGKVLQKDKNGNNLKQKKAIILTQKIKYN